MKKIGIFLILLLIGCSPASLPTPTIIPATSTKVSTPTFFPTKTQTVSSFSVTQIRIPDELDGRQVLTAFWSTDETTIYYALVNEIGDVPVWFEISMRKGEYFQIEEVSSIPQLIYTPVLLQSGIYLDYQGLISPSKLYQLQITKENAHQLYFINNIDKSKTKLLESGDMNFRGAYWMPEEKSVVFGIAPEYGTEIYFYNLIEKNISTSKEKIGFEDWNITEWALSPNGKYIAILDANQSLNIFSVDGNYNTKILNYHHNIRWSGNSQRIYFYYGEQIYNPTKFGYFDIKSNTTIEITQISELKKYNVEYLFEISQDGKQIIFWQSGNIHLLSLH